MKPSRYALAFLALLLAAFLFGLHVLFQERFEEGDIYPSYSTLRTDPMGCRAMFAALGNRFEAARVFQEESYRTMGPDAALFLLGATARPLGVGGIEGRILDSLARSGSRVIVAYAPVDRAVWQAWFHRYDTAETGGLPARRDSASSRGPKSRDTLATGRGKDSSALAGVFNFKSWGFHTALDTASRKADTTARISGTGSDSLPDSGTHAMSDSTGEDSTGTEYTGADPDEEDQGEGFLAAIGPGGDSLPWISPLYFDSLDAAWTVLYRRDSLPVIVERALGKGSLVLIGDTYWASNEALFRSLPGGLLSRLIADRSRLYFDERHLGLSQRDSLADLLARYKLHLLAPSLLLLFLAYVWKARSGFHPAGPGMAGEQEAATEPGGNRKGMRGLLRRYIPPGRLLEDCYAQWRDTEGKASPAVRRVDAEARRILAGGSDGQIPDLIEGYRKIHALINEGKGK